MQVLLQRPPLPVDVQDNWWDTWGTVADWVAGLGTVGALLWAVYQYRGQLEDARRDQASRVTMSSVRHYHPNSVLQDSTFVIQNRSDLPVYNAALWLNSEATFFPPHVCYYLDSNTKVEWEIDVPITSASLTFRDATGRYWERDLRGDLERTTVDRTKWRHRHMVKLRNKYLAWWRQPGM